MNSRLAKPISKQEFARFLQKCTPPTGWPTRIAVANSGGPDSTCLLFLINRYLQDLHGETPDALPSAVVSLTIDHGMQSTSGAMAQRSADLAKKLGVRHITSKIPWNKPPFPPRPAPGEAFEGIGRSARYHVLFDVMARARASVLATGHHGDDQVETSLMRLARGTTEIGAGGMRRCRRWGMGANGSADSLGWAGLRGMRSWMIRPLLEVSKDRILATCEENNLEYVTDPTNFQPQLTIRNAIREMLSKDNLDPTCIEAELPPNTLESLERIQTGLASLESVDVDPQGGFEQLRAAVTVLSEQVEDIDSLVDSTLNRCHLPSPSGTCMVSSRGLATIRDRLVQRSFVLRIMRYVSFHAWGTLRADANRRRESLDSIIKNLWTPDPFEAGIKPFVNGGGVMWTPVIVGPSSLRIPEGPAIPGPAEMIAWLASRQPPLSPKKLAQLGLTNPLRADLTEQLVEKLRLKDTKKSGGLLEVLWDCRFAISVDIDRIPDDLAREISGGGAIIKILPHSRWYWPKVVVQKGSGVAEETLHSTIHVPTDGTIGKLDRDMMLKRQHVRIEEVTSDWIKMEWIRSLAA